jgi:hypothetical protein
MKKMLRWMAVSMLMDRVMRFMRNWRMRSHGMHHGMHHGTSRGMRGMM